MSFFLIYNRSNWRLLIVFTLLFATFGIITERTIKKWLGHMPAANDIVSNFLSIIGVFYGIMLGLIAIYTWSNYSEIERLLSKEATKLGALHKNVSYLSSRYENQLKKELVAISRYIIFI